METKMLSRDEISDEFRKYDQPRCDAYALHHRCPGQDVHHNPDFATCLDKFLVTNNTSLKNMSGRSTKASLKKNYCEQFKEYIKRNSKLRMRNSQKNRQDNKQ
jgi:hypothetical protein